VQTRKYEWLEFKDVALKPSGKAPAFVIKGKVTDAATGKPVAGARVGDDGYAGGKQWTTSDANGNYSYLTWYEEHNIKCYKPGYGTKNDILLTKVFGREKEKVLNFELMPYQGVPSSAVEDEQWLKWSWSLPEWGAVRLVAVFKPNEKPWKFWDPDGKPLPDFKADAVGFRDIKGDEVLAVIFERPMSMHGEERAADGKFYSILPWNQGEDVNKPIAWYGHGYGGWEDCGKIELDKAIRYDGHDYVLTKFWQQGDDKHCTVHVQMDYTFNRSQAVQVVAVDARGRDIPFGTDNEFVGNFQNGRKMMYYKTMMGLPTAKIAYLKLQTQPLAWAKFRNFALQPNESQQATGAKSAVR
jgi:hypothetical protein